MSNNGNILLNQIQFDGSIFFFKEIIPLDIFEGKTTVLSKDSSNNFYWTPIDISVNIFDNNRLKDTDIYYKNGRIGLGRFPLFNYKIDLSLPKDQLMTGFHIGDGSFGFSMGNGTSQGYIPEIIGVGADENDTGLYLVGIAGNNQSSHVPLIVLDGRDAYGKKLVNRPIVGITTGDYNNYVVLIDEQGNISINGSLDAKDIKVNGVSLIETLNHLQEQINNLKLK